MPNIQIQKAQSIVPVESWNMLKANKVAVKPIYDHKGNPMAQMDINDGEFSHTFSHTSRVSNSLLVTPAEVVAERFTGGQFFIVNEQLVDMRDSHYDGFVHDVNGIQRLIDTIGVSGLNPLSRGIKLAPTQGKLILSNVWGENGLEVPGYKEGGAFNSRLRYNWSPFSQQIRGVFELVRLICSNGMVGLTDFFNARIPMINRWEEHMDMAYRQIQNKVQNKVTQRISEMGGERASVGELMQISHHAATRLKQIPSIQLDERRRLSNIAHFANPQTHLGNVYREGVFEDKAIAGRVAGHLTTFDAWNLVTEMYSHTQSSTNSTDVALQRMANALMFDDKMRNQRMLNIGRNARSVSSFSSSETAFFGTMH